MSNKIRTAIFGVGNCASALVQGIAYYQRAECGDSVAGLMRSDIGGYLPRDIEFSAAFDVDNRKVGLDLNEAIFAAPNNTRRFADVTATGVTVKRGDLLDGVGRFTKPMIPIASEPPVNVAEVLRQSETEVALCYLPVGSEQAVHWYAEQCLRAGCALINCMPVFIASTHEWQKRFFRKRLPIIGDDVKSQVGATIVHRLLVDLFRRRGVRLDRTYQLNFGGNTDFLNMLERERLVSKKISKTNAVTSQIGRELPEASVHVGPSDYVAWLEDRKICHIRLEGCGFGDSPLSCEIKLEVWDSPNSAGVVIDAIRCAKLALDRKIGGALIGPSAYYMKSPPVQFTDEKARHLTEEFIAQHNGREQMVQVSGIKEMAAVTRRSAQKNG